MVKSGEVAWVQPKDKGTRPGPRSGHTTTCTREKAIIFGGCGVQEGRSAIFNETYILHISDGFRWELADVTGDVPSPPRYGRRRNEKHGVVLTDMYGYMHA